MDWIYILLSFFFSVFSLVIVVGGKTFIGKTVGFIICIYLSYRCLNSISKETLDGAAEMKNQKEYRKLNEGYKCPSCGMMAGHRIGVMSKGFSVGTFGLASNKIGKNYQCANCKYIW